MENRNFSEMVLLSMHITLFASPYSHEPDGQVDESKANNLADGCKFNSTGNLSLDLATFYECVSNNLQSNCSRFKLHEPGCDLVEQHLIKCGKVPINCSEWPEGGNEEVCCNSPKVIKEEVQETCARDCKQKEYFHMFLQKCFFDCLVRETKIIKDDKVDIEMVKKVLMTNANNSADWEKPIETAVEKCEKNFKG